MRVSLYTLTLTYSYVHILKSNFWVVEYMKIQLYKITLNCFSKWLSQFTFPPTMYSRKIDSHSLTFAFVRLLTLCKMNRGNWDIIVVFIFICLITKEVEKMFTEDIVPFSVKSLTMTFVHF